VTLKSLTSPGKWKRCPTNLGTRASEPSLRDGLLNGIDPEQLDAEILRHQAVIGSRASAVVSFNVEEVTSIPFILFKGGGQLCRRLFRERVAYEPYEQAPIDPGPTAFPVFFPHGLLSEGQVVLTQSEYDRLQAGVAMDTAVHIALGSHLVILGMSLDDSYLRHALLKHRRWLGDIFWFDASFRHSEWARVAHVTTVEIDHAKFWGELANAILSADGTEALAARASVAGARAKDLVKEGFRQLKNQKNVFDAEMADVWRRSDAKGRQMIIQAFVDRGLEVPEGLSSVVKQEK